MSLCVPDEQEADPEACRGLRVGRYYGRPARPTVRASGGVGTPTVRYHTVGAHRGGRPNKVRVTLHKVQQYDMAHVSIDMTITACLC